MPKEAVPENDPNWVWVQFPELGDYEFTVDSHWLQGRAGAQNAMPAITPVMTEGCPWVTLRQNPRVLIALLPRLQQSHQNHTNPTQPESPSNPIRRPVVAS